MYAFTLKNSINSGLRFFWVQTEASLSSMYNFRSQNISQIDAHELKSPIWRWLQICFFALARLFYSLPFSLCFLSYLILQRKNLQGWHSLLALDNNLSCSSPVFYVLSHMFLMQFSAVSDYTLKHSKSYSYLSISYASTGIFYYFRMMYI